FIGGTSNTGSEATHYRVQKSRYDAYIRGLAPMLKYAKNGMFEAIIEHENETARKLDDDYNQVLAKALASRTERVEQLRSDASSRTHFSLMVMVAAFIVALVMSLLTFVV
ncbi:Tar ligand binding domain-containing protein, partial [Leptospira borgpetersenii serovar Ballum]|nr:Tar ligand binding domain-containing protein [Leptospira borgpetersenii serovar Ballum]